MEERCFRRKAIGHVFSREKTPRMTEYGGELALRVDIMVDGTTHHKL